MFSPLVELLSLLTALGFGVINIQKGINSSGTQFGFWLVRFICRTITFTSVIRYGDEMGQVCNSTCFIINYTLSIAVFLLHFWSDSSAKQDKYIHGRKPSPEATSSFPNKLLFSWMTFFLKRGYQSPLTMEDLYDLDPTVRCANVFSQWQKQWNKITKRKYNNVQANVLYPIFYTFGLTFLWSSVIQLMSVLLNQASPQALNLLIGFISSGEEHWKGYLYMGLLVGVNSLVILLNSQYFIQQLIISLKLKSSLTSAIFRKSFKLSSKSRKERTIGESVNLIQIDSQRLQDVIQDLNLLWSSPLTIVLSIYFLWGILGPSCLAGLTVMVLLIPINTFVGGWMKKFQQKNMKHKDNRMKSMNEVLDGIKVLKLYAWEQSFEEQIENVRSNEVRSLKRLTYLKAVQTFIFNATPFFVAIASFATYVLSDEENVLDAQKAFVSLSYFNIMRNPLSNLPELITKMVQAQVSIDRLNKYLNASERNPNDITNEDEGDTVIRVSNGNFAWEEEEENSNSVLENINMEVKRNQLVAIVGQVGSGKSSLLSAMINDLSKTGSGTEINVNGSISYVSQQSWLQNASLQHNITFGQHLDETKYNDVIDGCALGPDLDILPNGDMTEIGEKGINLSGGQKQRIAIARAVYHNADIFLLDDPLSAVDVHVGKHIFDKVIGPNGLLKNKTRLLVTHSVKFLPYVDKIIVLKEGKITEMGTYKELLQQNNEFSDFLVHYLKEEDEKLLKKSESESDITKPKITIGEENPGNKMVKKVKLEKEDEKPTTEKTKLMTTEKVETDDVGKSVYAFYFKAIGVKVALSILILNIVQQAFSIGTNVWLSAWSDDPDNDVARVRNFYLAIYGLLGTLGATLMSLVTSITAIGGLNASKTLHDKMLHSVLKAPLFFFDTNPKGRIINRFAKDIDMVDSNIPRILGALMRLGLHVVGIMAVITTTVPIFITIIVPVSVGLWFLQKVYVSSSRQLMRLESSSRSPVYSWFGESVSGVSTIKAFQMEQEFCKQMEDKVDTNSKTIVPNYLANRWLSIRLELLGNVIVLFAALLAVLGRDSLEAGLVGLSLSYAMQITGHLNCFIKQTSQVESNMVSVERIKEYEDDLPQEDDWTKPEDPLQHEWPSQGHIQVDKLEMRYRDGLPLVLKGVNLDIGPGAKIGVVGRTGSGKSSLTLSLFRINEPSGGGVKIDDIDIEKVGLGTLRSALTIIPQDPVLFSGSLRMNLDPLGNHTDAEMWNALELAHLKSYASSLPGGLDFILSEGGGNLSVGQRQLVCLARACLRKTKILFLDEATAAVDLETDDLIQATIRNEFASCTIITIAHRINTIMDCDKIVVMEDGVVAECDTPQNLLQKEESLFHSLAKEAGLVKSSKAQ